MIAAQKPLTIPHSRRLPRMLPFAAAFTLWAGACSAQQLTVTPFHKSGIYDLGEKAGWEVSLPEGAPAPTNRYTYTLKQNSQVLIKSGQLDLSSGKTTIEAALNEPAMLLLQITPPAGARGPGGFGAGSRRGGGGGGGNLYGAAIAPTKLQPSAPCPSDFDEFWQAKLKALSQVPINPVLSNGPASKEGVEFYTVTLDSLNSHVHGYLAKPAKEGKFPAMLYYQYAGVYALDKNIALNRASEGWLVLNVDSHDLAPDRGSGVSTGYQSIGNTNRETSYFLNMYLRDKRAADYLASRPDWNGKVLVAMGFSMGGQQSLATAGLDPRITHVIVEVPAGADFDGPLHGRVSGYPNWPGDNARAMEAGLYFDIVNFAARVKATTFLAMGFRDTVVSPVGDWIAFNQLKGPKEIAAMALAGHNNQSTPEEQKLWNDLSEHWLKTLAQGGEVKPEAQIAIIQ